MPGTTGRITRTTMMKYSLVGVRGMREKVIREGSELSKSTP
jgi:hypothetical protein